MATKNTYATNLELYGKEQQRHMESILDAEERVRPPNAVSREQALDMLMSTLAIPFMEKNESQFFTKAASLWREFDWRPDRDPLDDPIQLWIICSESDPICDILYAHGVTFMRDLMAHSPSWFSLLEGVGEASAFRIKETQREFLKKFPEISSSL